MGIEPIISSLPKRCFPTKLQRQEDGAGDRHQTRNLRFTKPLLCQLSYTGKVWWTREELNLLLPRCERGGLPMTYAPMMATAAGVTVGNRTPDTRATTVRFTIKLQSHRRRLPE